MLDAPAFSVQYHPEASPGPHDARQLFARFVADDGARAMTLQRAPRAAARVGDRRAAQGGAARRPRGALRGATASRTRRTASYEVRLNGMLDYYLYDFRPSGGTGTTLERFLEAEAPSLAPEDAGGVPRSRRDRPRAVRGPEDLGGQGAAARRLHGQGPRRHRAAPGGRAREGRPPRGAAAPVRRRRCSSPARSSTTPARRARRSSPR